MLIDYLEEAAAYLQEHHKKLQRLEGQYKKIYDRDIKAEMVQVKKDIRKKSAEIREELLLNLEEFRYFHKYFPELLQAFVDDEYIGSVLTAKAWLLDFKQLDPKEATVKFQQIREWRAQLRDARNFLRNWFGSIDSRSFTATYPVLRGYVQGKMEKDEVLEEIKRADRMLLKQGWLLLLVDPLIEIPLGKFMQKFAMVTYEETTAKTTRLRMKGKGTVAEVSSIRKWEKLKKEKEKYEKLIRQILLANPDYLRKIKKKQNWLVREKRTMLQRIAEEVTPNTIKERIWLNEMRKRLGED